MNPGYRIVGFVVALAAVFGVAFGIGRAVDPWGDDAPTQPPGMHQQHGG